MTTTEHIQAFITAALRAETSHTAAHRTALADLTASLDVPTYLRRKQGARITRLRRLVEWHGSESDRYVIAAQRWVSAVVGCA